MREFPSVLFCGRTREHTMRFFHKDQVSSSGHSLNLLTYMARNIVDSQRSQIRFEPKSRFVEPVNISDSLKTLFKHSKPRGQSERTRRPRKTNSQIPIGRSPNAPKDEILPRGESSLLIELPLICFCAPPFHSFSRSDRSP